MKRIVFALCVVAATALAFTYENEGLARVIKISGKEVYVLSEPLKPYDVVEKLNVDLNHLTGGGKSIHEEIEKAIDLGNKQVYKRKMEEYDAVYTLNGETLEYIKFRN